jgi:hypothetical protein
MKRYLFSLLVLTTIVLAACQPQAAGVPSDLLQREVAQAEAQTGLGLPGGAVAGYAPVEAPASEPVPSFADALAGGNGGDGATSNVPVADRLVIKNVSLSLVVDDTTGSVEAITQLAESMGGFVVALNTYQTTYGPEAKPAQQATLTIRVPSVKLNEALKQIKGMAVEVKNENISGQDVTSEYTDLKSRLTNLEAAEKQLQSIMAEANKTEDVLAVYNQLVYTREQIEVIKGQMKYYEEASALSAISIELIPNIATQPIEVGGWKPEGVAKQAIEDTIRFLQNATDGLIYFGIARLPFLLLVGLPAFFIGRAVWKRTSKKQAAA